MKIQRWTEDLALWIMYISFYTVGYLAGTNKNWDTFILFAIIVPLSVWLRHKARNKINKKKGGNK